MKKIIAILLIASLFIPCAYAAEIPENAYGIIYIPALELKMPVYTAADKSHESRQQIIDNEESALISNWFSAYDIGDHVGSAGITGEWYIQKIYPGAYAYLYTETGTYYLEAYLTAKTEYDGNEYINGRLVTPNSSHDIMLSCCAEDTNHHFIAVFRRIKELT